MATDDRFVTIEPYFRVKPGEEQNVRSYLERFVEMTRAEPDCLYYGFTFCGDRIHCREGYTHGAGALAHLGNVGPLLTEMLESGIAELTDLQIHGPAEELEQLKEPLNDLNPSYWTLEYGFRV